MRSLEAENSALWISIGIIDLFQAENSYCPPVAIVMGAVFVAVGVIRLIQCVRTNKR